MIEVVKITCMSCKESYFSQHRDHYCCRCNGDMLDREFVPITEAFEEQARQISILRDFLIRRSDRHRFAIMTICAMCGADQPNGPAICKCGAFIHDPSRVYDPAYQKEVDALHRGSSHPGATRHSEKSQCESP